MRIQTNKGCPWVCQTKNILRSGKALVLLFLIVTAFPWTIPAKVFAQTEEEMKILEMFYDEKDLVVTPSRDPKPISQVAENITVITAREIQAMNAHSLADVLRDVPGIQLDLRGGPGTSIPALAIQGSENRHVLVMIDGVALNNLSDNLPDVAATPVQHIERIEIIKGPASSSWGSSLGGVINIITKSPDESREFGGLVSAAMGKRVTGNYRADVSGKKGALGYYLMGGGLTSDGLLPNNAVDKGDLYTKLEWEYSEQTKLMFSLGYNKGTRGSGQNELFQVKIGDQFQYLFYTLNFTHALTDRIDLDFSFRKSEKDLDSFVHELNDGLLQDKRTIADDVIGGSAKLIWRQGMHQLVMGADVDYGSLRSNVIAGVKQQTEKWAVFGNDTILLGGFSLIPGVRFDHTSTSGDFMSPSLGVTYTLAEKTFLRGYLARAFSSPPLGFTFGNGADVETNPALKMEKVWSYSVGLETTALNYAWLKSTYFWHDISEVVSLDKQSGGTVRFVNKGSQRRQGIESELKTIPLFDTSLSLGFTYLDATKPSAEQILTNPSRFTYDLGILYNDKKSFSAGLKGHYVSWNAESARNDWVWDLNLGWKILRMHDLTAELIFSAHNLFNGTQYLDSTFLRNTERWLEGGVKFRF